MRMFLIIRKKSENIVTGYHFLGWNKYSYTYTAWDSLLVNIVELRKKTCKKPSPKRILPIRVRVLIRRALSSALIWGLLRVGNEISFWDTIENVEVGAKRQNKRKKNVNFHSFQQFYSFFIHYFLGPHLCHTYRRGLIKSALILALKWGVIHSCGNDLFQIQKKM